MIGSAGRLDKNSLNFAWMDLLTVSLVLVVAVEFGDMIVAGVVKMLARWKPMVSMMVDACSSLSSLLSSEFLLAVVTFGCQLVAEKRTPPGALHGSPLLMRSMCSMAFNQIWNAGSCTLGPTGGSGSKTLLVGM